MKKTLLLLTAAVALALSAYAEWEQCRLGYVWTGEKEPASMPEDRLKIDYYDYRRRADGTYYVYSAEYTGGKRPYFSPSFCRRLVQAGYADPSKGRTKKVASDNPSNSPDLVGHFMKVMQECVAGNTENLKQYYKYPASCTISHFYLKPWGVHVPLDLRLIGGDVDDRKAAYETLAAYNLDNPRYVENAWVAVCKGRVKAPKTMQFRFVGTADDYLGVKFNGKLVLDTGYRLSTEYVGNGEADPAATKGHSSSYIQQLTNGRIPGKEKYIGLRVPNTHVSTQPFSGMMIGGDPISVEEDQEYDIEIIIGNNGGQAHLYLLTQEVTGSNNEPLHLFRTNSDLPYKPKTSCYEREAGPPVSADAPIWQIAEEEYVFKKRNKKKRNKKSSKNSRKSRGKRL